MPSVQVSRWERGGSGGGKPREGRRRGLSQNAGMSDAAASGHQGSALLLGTDSGGSGFSQGPGAGRERSAEMARLAPRSCSGSLASSPGRLTGRRMSWARSGPRPEARDTSGRALGPGWVRAAHPLGAGSCAGGWGGAVSPPNTAPAGQASPEPPAWRKGLRPDPSAGRGAPQERPRTRGGRSRTPRAG